MSKQQWKPGNMVYPLPAVMVSCKRPGERPNIITVAWCGTVCTNPAMVSISVRPERYSYDIMKETGEFVINLTTGDLTLAADFCGVRSGSELDKFDAMGLTPLESQHISAPGIAESPVNIECRIKDILPLGSHHMFLAEVVGVSVDESLLGPTGRLELGRADLTAYSHGTYYRLGEEIGTFGYSVRKKAAEKDGEERKQARKTAARKAVDKKDTSGKIVDKKSAGEKTVDKKTSQGKGPREKKADSGKKTVVMPKRPADRKAEAFARFEKEARKKKASRERRK